MADFFKGLAGGFQTGLQFGEAVRRRQEYEEQQAEREQLRGIFTGQPTTTPGVAATPEQLDSARRYTEGIRAEDLLTFGDQLRPGEAARYAPQMPSETATTTPTTYSYGGLTRQTPFSAAELNRMRMEQAVPVLAVRNPAQALQMQETLLRSQREAERAPLEMEKLRGDIAGQGLSRKQLQLQNEAAERAAASQRRVDRFMQEYNANPNLAGQDLRALASRMGLNLEEQYKAVQTITGINDQELKQSTQAAERIIRGNALPGIVDQFNRSQIFGPGQNFVLGEGPGGSITLTSVDSATGRPVGAAQTFKNEAEAKAELLRQVRDPVNAADHALNVRYMNARIDALVGQGKLDEARMSLISMQKDALQPFPPETMTKLNDLSNRIEEARAAGNNREASALTDQWTREYNTAASKRGALIRPPGGAARAEITLNDAEKIAWTELTKSDQWKMAQNPGERIRLIQMQGLDPAKFGFAGKPSPTNDTKTDDKTKSTQPGLTRPTAAQIAAREPAAEAPAAPGSAAALAQERAAAEQQRTVGLLGREQQRASAQGLVDQLLYRGLDASNINRFMTPAEARTFYSVYGEFLPSDIQRAMRAYAAGIR